jgi:basic membrane lipoprotein Med (substrate-binding protein (PBP1-ABC) superfamily)
VSEINAFAIGAALINPDIRIHLKWSCVKECNWKKEFRAEGIDLVSGPELIMRNKASREYGLFRVRPDDTTENIAFPVWDWGKYYESIIKEYMDGEWDDTDQNKGLNYFWGMSSGLIDIILSGHLSYYSKKLVDSLRTVLINGILNPFDGEVHSQEKIVKVDGQPSLTYEGIVSMSWLNDNVEGRLPDKDEIKEEALETISVSGILDNYL